MIAALKQPDGSSATILRLWREGKVELLASDETLREAELVLGAGWLARISKPGAVDELLRELRERAVRVRPVRVTDLRLKDRGDLDLVEAAVGGGAQYLVTADREVLLNRGYGSVEFLDSREFVSRLQNGA